MRTAMEPITILAMGLLGIYLCGCASPTPAPARSFATSDLLIDPTLLPAGWRTEGGPTEYSAHSLGLDNSLGGSAVELRDFSADAGQTVARFPHVQSAAKGFADRPMTRDTQGTYGTTWTPLADWVYHSPIADQFRIMCSTTRNVPRIGAHCVIEAQYEEFLSILIYSTLNSDRAMSDLTDLAKAIDSRMERYLKGPRGK